MSNCIYCGAQVEPGVKFCTSCGSALPVEAPVEVAAEVIEQPGNQPQPPIQQQPQQAYQQPVQQPYQQGQQQYQQQYQQPNYQNQQPYGAPVNPVVDDSGSIGWGVLGFFIPLVGLILFLVWKNTKPKCAKVSGIGALIGFCLGLVLNFATCGVMMAHM